MTITEATDKVKKMAELHAGKLNATTNFQLDDDVIHLDDTVSPLIISNELKPAQCTVKMSYEDFDKLMSGELNPMMAFMTGKMKVDGDKGIAMKLSGMF